MSRNTGKKQKRKLRGRDREVFEDLGDIAFAEKERRYREPRKIVLHPQTVNQKHFINAMKDSEVCAAIGPAGVGKTYCAAGVAAQMLMADMVDGFILTRANVVRGATVGFLPGTKDDKMTPLLMPIIDALKRHLGEGKVNYMIDKGQIEMLPFEYVRGRSFINKFVIIDEAQNLTTEDAIAIVTRYETGRIVLLGDPFQNDLKVDCGLVWLHDFAKRNDFDMPITLFQVPDIVRSGFVRKFIELLYREYDLSGTYSRMSGPSLALASSA